MARYRINRALALAGVAASRRKAEQFVRDGRITVNGRLVTELATEIDPATDEIRLDGKLLSLDQPHRYYLYYKPRGLISTMQDVTGRPCVGEVCRSLDGNPRPVGRLDRRSEGLLLLTSDGELANRLAHPSFGVVKEYQVTASPAVSPGDARLMTENVPLQDGPARFISIRLLAEQPDRTQLAVEVDEGRNRLVRRVFGFFGYDVLRLKRVRQGELQLGRMKPGEIRELADKDVRALRSKLGL